MISKRLIVPLSVAAVAISAAACQDGSSTGAEACRLRLHGGAERGGLGMPARCSRPHPRTTPGRRSRPLPPGTPARCSRFNLCLSARDASVRERTAFAYDAGATQRTPASAVRRQVLRPATA